jgi:hypothetical protein
VYRNALTTPDAIAARARRPKNTPTRMPRVRSAAQQYGHRRPPYPDRLRFASSTICAHCATVNGWRDVRSRLRAVA